MPRGPIWRMLTPMKPFAALLLALSLAAAGALGCAPSAMAGAATDSAHAQMDCHEGAADETAMSGHHGADGCPGGAACPDCALGAGLIAPDADGDARVRAGLSRTFAYDAFQPRRAGFDPPPPRA